MVTITVPNEYGYVLLAATSTFFLGTWHGVRSGLYRKAAGPSVTYPTPYADSYHSSQADSPSQKKSLYLFNCAQRAHGNFLENQPSVLTAMLIAGLRFPVASAIMGGAWTVMRVVYMYGYTSETKEGGKGRMVGSPMWLFQFGLYFLSGWTAWKMVA